MPSLGDWLRLRPVTDWLAAHREPAYYSRDSGLLKGGALSELGSPEPLPQGER